MGQSSSTPRADEESILKEVKSSPVVIYTKTMCPFSKKARELLQKEQIEYKENDLLVHERLHPADHQSYFNGLKKVTNQTTVPQVFICGKFIGGFTELQQLVDAGKLLDAIAECATPKQKLGDS